MFLTLDEGSEISNLEWAAKFLKARANATVSTAYNGDLYEWDKQRALVQAAECLRAADTLQGRANMLENFGRDYVAADFHTPEDEE